MKIPVRKIGKKTLRRMSAFCLCAALIVGIATYFPAQMRVAAVDTTQKTIYRWDRVYTQSDLKSGPIIIYFGPDSNTLTYFTKGAQIGERTQTYVLIDITYSNIKCSKSSDYPLMTPEIGSFYTTSTSGMWNLKLNGTDSGNGNAKTGIITLGNNSQTIGWDGTDIDFDDPESMTIVTSDVNCELGRKTSLGNVMIFHNDHGGLDEWLGPGSVSGTLEMWETKSEFSNMSMFVCTALTFNTINYNLTVHSGTTLRLEGNYMLDSNYEITVEPGAVLSVDGEFLCNGTIRNYGTVIYEEDAYVHPMQESTDFSSSIFTYGSEQKLNGTAGRGNIIVMEGAYVELTGLMSFGKGSSLVNSGIIVTKRGIRLNWSQLVQNETGLLYCGYTLPNCHGPFKSIGYQQHYDIEWGYRKILGIPMPYIISQTQDGMYLSSAIKYTKEDVVTIYDRGGWSVIRCEGDVYLNGESDYYSCDYEFAHLVESN